MSQRLCLVRDEQDGWYCIPVSLRERFWCLLANACRSCDEFHWRLLDDAFDRYRLLTDLEDYTFTDWEEEE